MGSAIKTLDDLYSVVEFFEARRGQLYGFRFRDPLDFRSCRPAGLLSATDVRIGLGTGAEASFQLVKFYGDGDNQFRRIIAKPKDETLLLAVDGEEALSEQYSLDATSGVVTFKPEHVPADGAFVTAGFEFDVPVRFDIDQIEINLTHFHAGQVPHVALVEILP